MPRPRFYYGLKPYVPWRVRVALRRVTARKKRAEYATTWPIDESAGILPLAWPGWPERKRFAFVITHDIEGPEGLAKCRQLAELEMQLGFRSSFNFIPEGTYKVPLELRNWLTERGFEVGVHDLHHDGKLYLSRETFRAKAKRINQYLKEWDVSGFRSGFMLHELDWIHDLEIKYDCSTFDTDPFEPQPDAAGTIFPFWVPRDSDPDTASVGHLFKSKGYVELPYTLPQDSTLFLVLQEKGPEIWFRKLKWIAEHRGLALINVHPDYMCFDGEKSSSRTFPVEHYASFLRHIRDSYEGEYWHSRPADLASWYVKEVFPQKLDQVPSPITANALANKRAAVIVYSYYPSDTRVRRAAEAMVGAGMSVDLLCLTDLETDPPKEVIQGVNVFRVPIKRRRGSKWAYLSQYGRFFLSSFWFLTIRGIKQKYDVVHVHNMPDFLIFAAVVPRVSGAGLILDLHDPMPELMTSIYGMESDQWQVRFLKWLERRSISFSTIALTPNITFKNLFVGRSCRPDKMQIVMNSPDQDAFDPMRFATVDRMTRSPIEFRLMHHGSIVHRHGLDILVEALALLKPKIPGIRLDIYGHNEPFLKVVFEVAERLGVSDRVHFHGAKPPKEIAEAIHNADLGIIPNRRSAFTALNFPTRIFEYLAMNRPVIAPTTRGITDYFSENDLLMFEQENLEDLADKIFYAWDHPAEVKDLVVRGRNVYRQHLWNGEKARYLDQVEKSLKYRQILGTQKPQ
jgi:glycosyltransferase involved in cell wall biosynthesis